MLLKIKIAFCLLSVSILFSCGDSLKKEINVAIRKDKVLDNSECKKIKDYISNNPKKYSELFEGKDLNESKYYDFISNYIKSEIRDGDGVKIECSSQIINPHVNIYIENSGSMDGYVNGNTQYKASLSDLLVQLRGVYDPNKIDPFFINSAIYKSEIKDVKNFISELNPKNKNYKIGNTSTSELNETLKLILSTTDDKSISLFFSDFIYSLDKNQNTISGLGIGKSLTKDAFLQRLNKTDFSTLILKFESDFDGFYYSSHNKPSYYKGQRPFYIWILGNPKLINDFISKIKINELQGFQNSYFISNTSENNIQYSIIQSNNDIGTYKISREKGESLQLDNVKSDNGKFKFTVAVDYNKLPDANFGLDANNYKVIGDFKILDIKVINQTILNDNFKPTVVKKIKESTATHLITLESTKPNFDKELSLQLTNQIPKWVFATNTNSDDNVATIQGKTFGFKYLIEGVNEAYSLKNNNQNNQLINLKFTLNR